MLIEMRYSIGGLEEPLIDEIYISFSSAEDLASKVAQFLTAGGYGAPVEFEGLGGVWTVTAVDSGGTVTITDISGINAKAQFFIEELTFFNEAGQADPHLDSGRSVHTFTPEAYQNPYIEPARVLLTSTDEFLMDPTYSTEACVFESNTPLVVSGMGDGNLMYKFTIGENRIDLLIEIRDDEDILVASCSFEYTTPPGLGAYECDKRYELTKVAGSETSILGPSNGGPASDAVADWSGTTTANMNRNSAQYGN